MRAKEDNLFVSTQEFEVEVPNDFNPIAGQVKALEAQKSEALDAYQKSVAGINERLSKLMAITNEVPA